MGLFRLAIGLLAIVGIVSLAGSALGGAAATGLAAIGAIMFLPLLLFKVLLLVGLIGFASRMACGGGRPRGWRRSEPASDRPADEDRFDEWHRMAHAREEVDSWAPEM